MFHVKRFTPKALCKNSAVEEKACQAIPWQPFLF